ncbi:glycoside hydrolase family 2 TIM barrel-domain containing protein [Jeotgalibacillus sp. ET6]|uniref:glycoside hydrolase family 2 TIM barrel-domain containing protein n=1 Tax=Jeotgalibacillus sp. ET6 TaxID=3037260 RepID=UPI0024183983|nr:glycoside hydrolase family 2 TIM barrel-domain containing protein [Jeotgalibacillus sp. ET6]MDG5473632.1 glycoside hydrolase family 2 TIM barrel-domain containing protein [Jeotgalibacillus sp. ET6]
MNSKTLFNEGWEFAKSALDVSDYESLEFSSVDLPHDWLIYNTQALYENSIGWYRKRFIAAKGEFDHILLMFEGVYMDSSLYVNQQYIGEWKYGYSQFEHEITDAIVDGENEILLKVVHQSPNSRWYSGAGIYRNVWLKTRSKNHIVSNGVYISTRELEDHWQVEVETELQLDEDVQLSHSILYNGEEMAVSTDIVNVKGQSSRQSLYIKNPLMWSTEHPHLYQLKTVLHKEAEQVESQQQNLGFRTVSFDSNEGFKLNNQHMKLNGVCEHHDLGALGAAFNKTALQRRFEILKEMGVNSIRTAHNMPAKELMELADEMGMLIVSEAFDMWERSKTPYDYARFFKEWSALDVESWVRRDRNHPSLILWSIGNEIYDTHADERGVEITRQLTREVQKHDPKENAGITIGSNYMPWENAQKCADIVKIAGYNYAEKYYSKHHEEHPDWIIYGSETASVVQSRGIYHFPYEKSILADDDEQCSALGNSSTSWGAKSAEACILAERDTPFSLGQFLWTGFDYIGEPTPYHTKNSYFGQIDTATFKKDSYYLYQAAWTDYKKSPMVHIFPYWDFNEGQIIDVRVCSNAPKIELQLNGRLIGTHDIDHQKGTQLVGWWKIPFEKGKLKAIAYDEQGNVIALDKKGSFEDPVNVCLKGDKNILKADGTDLLFVEINVKDEKGNVVENATNRVEVKVTGAARLVGLDNGDSTDYDSYKGTSRRLFSGKLMAIVASGLESGEGVIEVTSEGLEKASLTFELQQVQESVEGICARAENKSSSIITGMQKELPLRKIEIISESGQLFDPSKRQHLVKAKLYPKHASYQEVEWSVVNDVGITSAISTVQPNGHEALVTALGDGEFRLRCTSKNGTDKTKLISELEFRAEGLGTAYKNPYDFISGGLYEYSKGEVSNGNERGVATSRDGETQVGYRGLDFGSYGSDTITIPIFALSDEEYSLQIWEGMPDEEGSELLADVIYQKKSKWNVYQPETYLLSKRLRGITSICFVLNQKVHIKGFSFEKQNKTFERINASDCDAVYGDAFTMKETSIEGIGNNVSIEFREMDFTTEGTSRVVIEGNTAIDNTIHIRFANDEEESNQIVEFAQTDGVEERVFNLDKITGVQKVTFVFLPGSNFDFNWFRFEK